MKLKYLLLSIIMLLIGILLFAIQQQYIIFNFRSPILPQEIPNVAYKKNVSLWYWHHDAWHHEQMPFLFSETLPTLQPIISQWLDMLFNEKIVRKKIKLEEASLSSDHHELFVSFDRTPWNKENSLFEKWMIIEGLLKTIKNADSTIQKVRFLVNHQPLLDFHLDCTNAWPIQGFLF